MMELTIYGDDAGIRLLAEATDEVAFKSSPHAFSKSWHSYRAKGMATCQKR